MKLRLAPILQAARRQRRWVASFVYAAATASGLWIAYLLRFELHPTPRHQMDFWAAVPWLIGIRLMMVQVFRVTQGRWRFVGVSDVVLLSGAVASSTVLYFALSWGFPLLPRVPRSVLLIEAGVTEYLIAAIWIAYRILVERVQHARHIGGRPRRVLMVGAGSAGQMLVREMQRTPTGMTPVGYVDDDPAKRSARIHGVRVQGAVSDLPTLVEKLQVDEIIIAIPSAAPAQIRRIVEQCEETGRDFSILPGIVQVLSGEAHLAQLREVRIEDLLGRDPVVVQLPSVQADLVGQTILITGAAGSIGSELARQIALHGPGRIILADRAETPLFYLDLELRAEFMNVEVVPFVVDITDREAVEWLFQKYRPQKVFHAAAYKHVPLMQRFPLEAVKNNVVGTWMVAEAAGRCGAEKFILVSTDKAVRPTSVMGATKRLAELAVLEAQKTSARTKFGVVRFGNVLGSNGSVIPVFRRQLAQGRPLTVTHEDVKRYFMTIPEAVQLILKASLLPELNGHVAMLEMGEPVRILDLARNFLLLAGAPYRPGENVIITGLRPGEKLAEELVAPEERVVPTDVAKVLLAVPDEAGAGGDGTLTDLEKDALVAGRAAELVRLLAVRFPGIVYDGDGRIPEA